MDKLLIVDDRSELRRSLAEYAVGPDREIVQADSLAQAIDLIRTDKFDVVITDLELEKGGSKEGGLEVLKAALARDVDTQVIVVTSYPSADSVVKAIAMGAFDYIDRSSLDVRYQDVLPHKISLALRYKKSEAGTSSRGE